MKSPAFQIGIDEAGRGPLAGPVAVGVVMVPRDFNWERLPGVNDSKKLSEKKREAIYSEAVALKRCGVIVYGVTLVSARRIDKIGIGNAVREGIERGLESLHVDPNEVYVKLDGLLRAPSEYLFQETIVGGDGREKVIGLASILAKVSRDTYMVRASKRDGRYLFETHKGYGTARHRFLIQRYGLGREHRRSFCKNVLING